MPDLPPLPPRPRPPLIEPRSCDLAEVLAGARTRRHRRQVFGGAMLSTLLLATFAVALTRSATDARVGLVPAGPRPRSAATSPPAAGPVEQDSIPRRGTGVVPPALPQPTAVLPSTLPGEEPEPTGTPVAEPTWPSDPEPTPDPRPAPEVRRSDVAYDPTRTCDQTFELDRGWCLRMLGPFAVTSGERESYRFEICRLAGAGTIDFATDQEIDLYVGNGDDEWSWAHGWQFTGPAHRLTVAASRCARWTLEWDTRSNDGDLLPPGGYSISPHVAGDLSGGIGARATVIAYQFTIRSAD